mmetsp:Transcript_56303/g.155369  ORF Transcript_56303/g.155369 Transcript_56303/m.155369 type:complete len:105 (-) Transcript_56303:354-668(-)
MSFSLARLAAATARSAAAAPMRASGAVAPARAGVAPSKVVVRNMGGLNPKTFSHNSHFHVSGFVHPWDAHPHHHHEHIHFVQEEIGEPTIVGEHEEHDEEDEDE